MATSRPQSGPCEDNVLVSRPSGSATRRGARTDEHNPPRGLTLLQAVLALARAEVRDCVREDGDEGEEVDVKEGFQLSQARAGKGRDGAERVERAGVHCGGSRL